MVRPFSVSMAIQVILLIVIQFLYGSEKAIVMEIAMYVRTIS